MVEKIKKILDYIKCGKCGSNQIVIDKNISKFPSANFLICKNCKETYMFEKGVFISGKLNSEPGGNNVERNKYSFGYLWDKMVYKNENWQDNRYFQSLLAALSPFSGDKAIEGFKNSIKGKNILIVGSGAGAEIPIIASMYPKEIFAIDIGESIYRASELYQADNIYFIECDLHKAKDVFVKKFDFIISCGVVHHTEDPISAIKSLLPLLSSQGYLSVLTMAAETLTGKLYGLGNFLRKIFFSKLNNKIRITVAYIVAVVLKVIFIAVYIPLNFINKRIANKLLPANREVYAAFNGINFKAYLNVALDYITAPVYRLLSKQEISAAFSNVTGYELCKLTLYDALEQGEKQNWRICIKKQ